MPHITLKDPGWSGLNGPFGPHEFINGRSVENLSTMDAQRIGAITSVVTDEGLDPSPTQSMIDMNTLSATVVEPLESFVEDKTEESKGDALEDNTVLSESDSEQTTKGPAITREMLESIADKQGISGLREVAADYKVTARSVGELIEKILLAVK